MLAFVGSVSAQVSSMTTAEIMKAGTEPTKAVKKYRLMPSELDKKTGFDKTSKWLTSGEIAKHVPSSVKAMGTVPSKTTSSRAATRASENNFWWGYDGDYYLRMGFDFLGEYLSQYYEEYSVLIGQTDYNVCMTVPYNYANAKIDSLAIFFIDPSTMSNVKVWISDLTYVEQDGSTYITVPSTPDEADVCIDLDTDDIEGATVSGGYTYISPTYIALPEEYTIPSTGCLIGYAFEDAEGTYPIVSTYTLDSSGYTNDTEGGFYWSFDYNGSTAWLDLYGLGAGNLAIMVNMDPTDMEANLASTYDAGEMPVILNESTTILFPVVNDSYDYIYGVSYEISVNGESLGESSVTFSSGLASGYYTTVSVPYTFTVEGVNDVTVTITKVQNANGSTDNGSTDNVSTATYIALEKEADRTSVVEQFTGTWCGWCPRGHVGMSLLKELYGDQIITLAGHYGDIMYCSDYYNVLASFGSTFPLAAFDRCATSDPYLSPSATTYAFGANYYVELIKLVMPSEGTVTLDAEWADDDQTTITASATYSIGYDRISLGDSPYGIAFILSEDGMTGDTDDWLQYNYYSSSYSSSNASTWGTAEGMSEWVNADVYASTTYDNVIVAAWDALLGVDGSVEMPITKNEEVTYTTTLDISGNTLIQDKDNLYLTALLINRNNYSIVNASQVSLNPDASTGIESVETAGEDGVAEVARYNANGVRLSAPQKGLNIVKYSDGTSKKVVVK